MKSMSYMSTTLRKRKNIRWPTNGITLLLRCSVPTESIWYSLLPVILTRLTDHWNGTMYIIICMVCTSLCCLRIHRLLSCRKMRKWLYLMLPPKAEIRNRQIRRKWPMLRWWSSIRMALPIASFACPCLRLIMVTSIRMATRCTTGDAVVRKCMTWQVRKRNRLPMELRWMLLTMVRRHFSLKAVRFMWPIFLRVRQNWPLRSI